MGDFLRSNYDFDRDEDFRIINGLHTNQPPHSADKLPNDAPYGASTDYVVQDGLTTEQVLELDVFGFATSYPTGKTDMGDLDQDFSPGVDLD